MSKMKSPEALEALARNPNYQMTDDEARLYDLLVFHKTGKHIDKFKNKNKKKPKPEHPVLKVDPHRGTPEIEKHDPEFVNEVLVKDSLIKSPSDVS